MATGILFDHTGKLFVQGDIDWDADTFKIALVTSSWTPAGTETQWADISANEVTTGSGYTTGGETMTTIAATNTSADANDVTWVALSKTFAYAVVYRSGTVGGLTDPVIGYIDIGNTTVTSVDYTVQWSVNGVFTITVS